MCFMVWDADFLKVDLTCSGKELREACGCRGGREGEDTFPFSEKNMFLTRTNTQQQRCYQ